MYYVQLYVFLLRTGTHQFAQTGVGAQVSSGINNTKVNTHSFSSIPTAVIRKMASMKADEKLSKEGELNLPCKPCDVIVDKIVRSNIYCLLATLSWRRSSFEKSYHLV